MKPSPKGRLTQHRRRSTRWEREAEDAEGHRSQVDEAGQRPQATELLWGHDVLPSTDEQRQGGRARRY